MRHGKEKRTKNHYIVCGDCGLFGTCDNQRECPKQATSRIALKGLSTLDSSLLTDKDLDDYEGSEVRYENYYTSFFSTLIVTGIDITKIVVLVPLGFIYTHAIRKGFSMGWQFAKGKIFDDPGLLEEESDEFSSKYTLNTELYVHGYKKDNLHVKNSEVKEKPFSSWGGHNRTAASHIKDGWRDHVLDGKKSVFEQKLKNDRL